MSKIESYKCDECGKVKGEANHWFRSVSLIADEQPERVFLVTSWDFSMSFGGTSLSPELHLCGMECVLKAMTKALRGE